MFWRFRILEGGMVLMTLENADFSLLEFVQYKGELQAGLSYQH